MIAPKGGEMLLLVMYMMKYLKMLYEEWAWDFSAPLRDTLWRTEKDYALLKWSPHLHKLNKSLSKKQLRHQPKNKTRTFMKKKGHHHPLRLFQTPLILHKTKINLLMKRVMMCIMMIKVKLMVKMRTKMIKMIE
jgi:hypothetical protein